MAGVIDEHGQWERCNCCGTFVLIQNLWYQEPSPDKPIGRDLCRKCALAALRAGKRVRR